MPKYAFYAFFAAGLAWSTPAGAGDLTVGGFADLFNASAGQGIRVDKLACPKQPIPQCEYIGDRYKILVIGDDETGAPDEIAVYIPRGPTATSRKQAAMRTATVLTALTAVAAPSAAPKERGRLMTSLIDGATRPPHRAERSIGGARYVLTATDPADFRIYVSWDN